MPSRREDCWTKAPPMTPGWYWWREDVGHDAKIVFVTAVLGRMEVFSFACHSARTFGGEWFGPIIGPGGDAIENCPQTKEAR